MNYRAILKVYKDERKLSDDETAFLNTLRKMNENEIAMLIESLSDKPQKKPGKKGVGARGGGADRCIYTFPASGAKCNLKADKVVHTEKAHPDYHAFYTGKSPRASGMAAAIIRSLESSRQAVVTDDDSEFERKVQEVVLDDDPARCEFTRADSKPCHLLPDHNIHHLESAAEYHEFQSLEKAAASSGD